MKTILIVDDEAGIRHLVERFLTHENYHCLLAENGKKACAIFAENNVDLVIMDIMMPEMDGYRAYKNMQKIRDTPCIFLSALGQEADKLYGFDMGAVDYIVKPFSLQELLRRVRVALRKEKEKEDVFRSGGIEIDFPACTLRIDGKEVALSLKEFRLLQELALHAGVTRSREELLQSVWGEDTLSEERTLDTHIKLLRKALAPYGEKIITVRGVGYRFEKVN